MSGQTFQPGEHVRVTIEGVIQTYGPSPDVVTIRAGNGIDVYLPWETGTIERVAPPEWPPRPGDLWEDSAGDLWFAQLHDYPETDPHVQLLHETMNGRLIPWDPADVLSSRGPMKLARRRDDPAPTSGAVSTSDRYWPVDPPPAVDPALADTQVFDRIEGC